MVKISLARLLKVKPEAAEKFITVLAGSVIEKGDVVARKKGFLGRQIVVKSRISGLVDNYSSDTGELVIETGNTEVSAPVGAGRIPKIGKNKIKGVFGFGKGEGKLEIYDGCLEFTEINEDYAGKIILSKTISSNAAVYKASALGVEGLAVLCSKLRPRSKDIGFLVLSDKQDDGLWQKLKKWGGKMVRVEGEEIGCV